MKTWQLVVFGLLCGLLAAGGIALVGLPQRGNAILLPDSPPEAGLTVDVSGAVSRPGVYELPTGSRVEDAITAAGGLLADAYAESLNMAAPLSDGSKVLVPLRPAEESSDPASNLNSLAPQTPTLVNINTASVEELATLPGIGEVKAQAIITYRTEHGPFTSPEQIQEVSGIGPATYEKLKDLITIY